MLNDEVESERMPPFPVVGTVTVTSVPCAMPFAGVNTAVLPARCQDPATAGDRVGSGAEPGAAGYK